MKTTWRLTKVYLAALYSAVTTHVSAALVTLMMFIVGLTLIFGSRPVKVRTPPIILQPTVTATSTTTVIQPRATATVKIAVPRPGVTVRTTILATVRATATATVTVTPSPTCIKRRCH